MKEQHIESSGCSEEFSFTGSCYISIVGDGTVQIERKLNKQWAACTNDRGEVLAFMGDGVLFNNQLDCKKSIKHRVRVVSTVNGVTINYITGR